MKKQPENMYEIHFYQNYNSELKRAEKFLDSYRKTLNVVYIKEAWDIYSNIYLRINENYKKFDEISLKYVSKKLFNFYDSKISIPGFQGWI